MYRTTMRRLRDGGKYLSNAIRKRENRSYSNLPCDTVYGGPKPQDPVKRVTLRHLASKYTKKKPITMLTAYDYPSAVHVDQAGIDICLVGDSVGMVVHGHDTTLPVTMDDMLLHCRAVARGARRSLLVGDLPFGSYEQSPSQAVANATRLLKEGGMDAVKLEGGYGSRVTAAKAIVEAGIAVMGHVGLTPQAISALGGFRPQGQTSSGAKMVLEHALALQESGCFAIVLECLPSPVSAAITSALKIPTIGIGAGSKCSGQVLVYHDILGMMQHPHYVKSHQSFANSMPKLEILSMKHWFPIERKLRMAHFLRAPTHHIRWMQLSLIPLLVNLKAVVYLLLQRLLQLLPKEVQKTMKQLYK
ncbi:hypothetical protein KP509_35G053100 [Ceratopteris richardii]|uniref:3-methyl-2-oxobutanoate hydroxymethyltransferase n=1 Tax=Ceratopteris richardii TaxID=49495 RepID=A0A8T2QH15_CERRI|nr:hypothetical protein KP509_35G053100 [Ceratopteris richardii]